MKKRKLKSARRCQNQFDQRSLDPPVIKISGIRYDIMAESVKDGLIDLEQE